MAKIDLTQLIAEMTPEQKILMQSFYANFDNDSAANRNIVNVEPVFYKGPIAGHEILTYNANKLYIALEFIVFGQGISAAGPATINFNDENNARIGNLSIGFPYWDATAAAVRYVTTLYDTRLNFYFSRFELVSGVSYFKMIGYKFTLA